jgi:hypothetical protein
MEYGAIDLHKKESQIRIVTETGEIIDRRIATTRDRFTATFWGRPRMRILRLIRFGGHLPKGGYDVQSDGRHPHAPASPAIR